MKTVYLLRFSQISQSKIEKSIDYFHKATGKSIEDIKTAAHKMGGSPLKFYKPEEMPEISKGAIYEFKTGKITEKDFITRMNNAMGTKLSTEVFLECWNAMCTLQPETIRFLRQIEELKNEHGFSIHIIGSTNRTHAVYISEQLKENDITLKMGYTFSFVVGDLDPALPKFAEGVEVIDLRDASPTDILSAMQKNGMKDSASAVARPRPQVA